MPSNQNQTGKRTIKQKKGIFPKTRPKSARLPREAHRMLAEQYKARVKKEQGGQEEKTTQPGAHAAGRVTGYVRDTVRGSARYSGKALRKAFTGRKEKSKITQRAGRENRGVKVRTVKQKSAARPVKLTPQRMAQRAANNQARQSRIYQTRSSSFSRQVASRPLSTTKPSSSSKAPAGGSARVRTRSPMASRRRPVGNSRAANRIGSRTAAKSAIKTKQATQKAAKTAKAAAKHAARAQAGAVRAAAQRAAQAAKVALQAAIRLIKLIVQAVAALVKGILAIASGGAVFVIVFLAIMAVVLILSSPFGLFYSDDNPENQPISTIIASINAEIEDEIRGIAAQTTADRVVYDYEGDAGPISNWPEVLAVFAVRTASDEPDGADVLTMDDDRIERLRQVCRDMNPISHQTQTESVDVENPDGSSSTQTISVLYITIEPKTAQQQAQEYGFTPIQMDQLTEMLAGEFRSMLYAMLGVDPSPGLTPTEVEALYRDLPPGTLGNDIVRFALQHLGDPYSERDCSAFVRYCYAQYGIELPRSAAAQGKYCVDNNLVIDPSTLVPGDLIFFSHFINGRYMDITHVGIYAGNGMIVDSSSSRGQVVYRKLYSGQVLWGRPHITQ